MYTFKRLQNREQPFIVGWYLQISSFKELCEYKEKSEKSVLSQAFTDEYNVIRAEVQGWKQHPANRLNQAIHTLMDIRDGGWMDSAARLISSSFETQAKLLREGYTLYFNSTLIGYMFDKDEKNYLTLDEYTCEKVLFPNYKEVKYTQWDGGKHWYARVGNIDIYDKDGNMKWDTKEEAEKAVEWYRGSN